MVDFKQKANISAGHFLLIHSHSERRKKNQFGKVGTEMWFISHRISGYEIGVSPYLLISI